MMKTKNLDNIFFSSYIPNYLLILFAFFLTISPSISSIIIGLLCLNIIFFGKKSNISLKNKVSFSIVLFFGFTLISGFWFQENNSFLDLNSSFIYELQKVWVILLCPLLFLFEFDLKIKKHVQYAFINGLIVNVLLSMIIYLDNSFIFIAKTGHYTNEYYLHGFLDHSDLSILFCFGIFLVLEELLKKRTNKIYLLFSLFLFLFFLFNSYGRTGIICFIGLFPVFLILKYSSKLHFLLITSFSILIIVLSFSFSKSFSSRASETINEMCDLVYDISVKDKINRNATYMANQDSLGRPVQYWEQRIKSEKNEKGDSVWINHIINSKNENKTSLGKRVFLWKIYIKKIQENIILGKGLGSVDWLQKESTNVLDKPHNNYLFILTEFGIVGLLLFCNIFILMIKEFFMETKKNILKIIFPIIFLLSMCINDYFFIYNTLAFFGLFSYLLYSTKE